MLASAAGPVERSGGPRLWLAGGTPATLRVRESSAENLNKSELEYNRGLSICLASSLLEFLIVKLQVRMSMSGKRRMDISLFFWGSSIP